MEWVIHPSSEDADSNSDSDPSYFESLKPILIYKKNEATGPKNICQTIFIFDSPFSNNFTLCCAKGIWDIRSSEILFETVVPSEIPQIYFDETDKSILEKEKTTALLFSSVAHLIKQEIHVFMRKVIPTLCDKLFR